MENADEKEANSTKFEVFTKGRCFICSKATRGASTSHSSSSSSSSDSEEIEECGQFSLGCLCRHLQISERSIVKEALNHCPPEVAEQNEYYGNGIMAPLCDDCEGIYLKFCDLFQQHERIQLRMRGLLDKIQDLMRGSTTNKGSRQTRASTSKGNQKQISPRLEFADVLRDVVLRKCQVKKSKRQCHFVAASDGEKSAPVVKRTSGRSEFNPPECSPEGDAFESSPIDDDKQEDSNSVEVKMEELESESDSLNLPMDFLHDNHIIVGGEDLDISAMEDEGEEGTDYLNLNSSNDLGNEAYIEIKSEFVEVTDDDPPSQVTTGRESLSYTKIPGRKRSAAHDAQALAEKKARKAAAMRARRADPNYRAAESVRQAEARKRRAKNPEAVARRKALQAAGMRAKRADPAWRAADNARRAEAKRNEGPEAKARWNARRAAQMRAKRADPAFRAADNARRAQSKRNESPEVKARKKARNAAVMMAKRADPEFNIRDKERRATLKRKTREREKQTKALRQEAGN